MKGILKVDLTIGEHTLGMVEMEIDAAGFYTSDALAVGLEQLAANIRRDGVSSALDQLPTAGRRNDA